MIDSYNPNYSTYYNDQIILLYYTPFVNKNEIQYHNDVEFLNS